LTRRMNKATELMCDPVNLEEVERNVQKYTETLEDFNNLHKQYQQLLSKDECAADTEQWYEPKLININEFKIKVDEWIQSCPVKPLSEKGDEIDPKDSISLVSQISCKSSYTSSASARLVAQAEKAALLAKAAALKEMHALEEKEERLSKEREGIRRQRETLNVLSAANAKLAVRTSLFHTSRWHELILSGEEHGTRQHGNSANRGSNQYART